jgi:hypothetical protein
MLNLNCATIKTYSGAEQLLKDTLLQISVTKENLLEPGIEAVEDRSRFGSYVVDNTAKCCSNVLYF